VKVSIIILKKKYYTKDNFSYMGLYIKNEIDIKTKHIYNIYIWKHLLKFKITKIIQ